MGGCGVLAGFPGLPPRGAVAEGKERDEVRLFGALKCLLSGLSNAM